MSWPFQDHFIKLLLIGDNNVGKTSFLNKFLNKNEKIYKTIGLDYCDTYLDTIKGIIKLRIWDTSGSFTYERIIDTYYRTCHGIIFFYSDNNTLINIENWIKNIENVIGCKFNKSNIDCILIENKSDLELDIDHKKREEIINKYGFKLFKSNYNQDNKESVYYLLNKILTNQDTKHSIFKKIDKDEYEMDDNIFLEFCNFEIIIKLNK